MRKLNLKLYLIFIATFLVMHFTGVLVMNMPYIVNAVIVFIAVFVTLLLTCKWILEKAFKETISDLGFRKASFKNIIPGIVISIALLCMYPLLGYLLNTNIMLVANWQLNSIGILLTGGLAEEMLFRGFLYGELRRQMSFKKAVLVSAILFTLVHLLLFTTFSWSVALLSTVLAAGLSIPFAYLFERGSNSVWSPALVHATIRTVGMVFLTDEKNYSTMVFTWIIMSLFVPYVVLIFHKSFRKLLITKTN